MRWILRLSGATRKRFLRLPHWARDGYELLSYVNFIELIPTLVTIALAPRHFFRRLPRTLSGRSLHFKTPIKFFFNFAALFLALFFLRHGDLSEAVSHSQAVWLLPAIIPLTPLAMIALGIASCVLYQIPRLAPNGDAFPPPNYGPFKLLLNPRTYANLQRGRFFWGLFYISIYFLAAWQVVQFLIAVDFLGVVYLVDAMGEGHVIPKAITIILGIAIVAFSIHGLVLHPYMEMLRASLKRPTGSVFETDVFEICEGVREFLARPASDSELDAHAEMLHELVLKELASLRLLVTQQNIDYEFDEDDVAKRLQTHRKALQIEKLRGHLQHTSADTQRMFSRLLTSFATRGAEEHRRAA